MKYVVTGFILKIKIHIPVLVTFNACILLDLHFIIIKTGDMSAFCSVPSWAKKSLLLCSVHYQETHLFRCSIYLSSSWALLRSEMLYLYPWNGPDTFLLFQPVFPKFPSRDTRNSALNPLTIGRPCVIHMLWESYHSLKCPFDRTPAEAPNCSQSRGSSYVHGLSFCCALVAR